MRFTADLRMVRHSGIGRYLRNLFPLLLPQLQADQVRVLTKRSLVEGEAWLNEPRVELIECPAPIYSVGEQCMGSSYRDSDLLWVPHFNAPVFYSGRLAVTIHDIAPLAVPEILGNPIKRAYAKLLIERATGQASAILSVSEFTRTELVKRLRVPEGKITVTPLGLDAGWPTSAPPHVETDGTPYLLFVGNVKPNKNLSVLLTALTSTLDRLPYRLVVVGKVHGLGTTDDAVITQAKSLGDRVRFAGEVTDAELQSLYAGAAALVMPSLYEGFGLPPLEAMQLGCPVLLSSSTSLPEVGGDAALYFSPNSPEELANCLLQTLDPTLMATLRERGRERVQHFSFDRCAAQTAAVFNRLMGSPQ